MHGRGRPALQCGWRPCPTLATPCQGPAGAPNAAPLPCLCFLFPCTHRRVRHALFFHEREHAVTIQVGPCSSKEPGEVPQNVKANIFTM